VKPIFLDAGSPTADATIQFGTLDKGALFGPMGATGLGVEGQLATQNLGIRFGVTPQGFPIQNFIGSLQYRPWGGPFEISGGRQPVEETLLSYAGVRDPSTGLVWGGVVATGITGRGNWGTAESGIYSDLGYQYITGTRVANNSRISGTIGSYWRVRSQPEGNLTLGLNFSGMHYDKNLRYFTLGQGGYFSPQSYFLFNVPVHWRGIYHNRFEYSVDGSLGKTDSRTSIGRAALSGRCHALFPHRLSPNQCRRSKFLLSQPDQHQRELQHRNESRLLPNRLLADRRLLRFQ
jgi:hypothetical protein